jgi:hypothetical protein
MAGGVGWLSKWSERAMPERNRPEQVSEASAPLYGMLRDWCGGFFMLIVVFQCSYKSAISNQHA